MLAKFNGRLSKEAFLLHHILGYLKELCNDCRIKPFFTHAATIKMFEGELDVFSSARFVVVQYSIMNSREYRVAVLKGKEFCKQINGMVSI